MTTGDSPSQTALGFLTILEHEQHGLVGGYLILNSAGRPLEFHCTAPVKANRAQQILFGPTLESYLYGEQIGQTLLAKCSLDLLAVCTDVERALCVRDYVSRPVVLVIGGQANGAAAPENGSAATSEASGARVSPATSDLPSPLMGEGSGVRVKPAAAVGSAWRVDAAHQAGPHLSEFAIGRNRLAVAAHRDADRSAIAERLEGLATFDLTEPFERIRQAVEEAHKSGRT